MKTALVTGASRSIGAEIARKLAADGWAVAINYHTDDAAAEAVRAEIAAAGGQAIVCKFDVTSKQQIADAVERIAQTLSPIDLIVNNATGPQPFIPIAEQTWQDHLGQLEFFVKAPLELLQQVLPDWRQRKSGRVINIGSEVVETGIPGLTHYVAAKGAMLGMTRSLANELGPEGITVNLIAPGWIPNQRHADVPQSAKDEYLTRTAIGRFAENQDIADMVVYLASDAASSITGQKFSINGGRTLL